MVWIVYLMRMLPEAFATPARETRTYGGEELPAPREPLRRAVACQDQAEANRYLRFVCIKYDPRARNRSLIAERLIEQLKQELGHLLCGCDTSGVRLRAVPEE